MTKELSKGIGKGLSILALAFAMSGCVDSEQANSEGRSPISDEREQEQSVDPAADANRGARLAELDNQIRTMVGIARADSFDQCRLTAVGKRACGGPEYYIAYSTKVTDEKALQKLVNEYTQLRIEHINATQEMSTCEVIPEPQLSLENGVCRAVAHSTM